MGAEARTIEQTLKDLEIDTSEGVEGAEAAQAKAEETSQEVEAEEDNEAEGVAIPIPPPRGTGGRKNKRRETEPEPKPEAEEEEGGEDVAIPHVPVPPPAAAKPKVRPKSPSVGRIGKGLADKVPGAEKVQVFKRDEKGKKWFISEYTKQDIANHTDFNSFLVEYVLPENGPGEYILVGVDAHAREMELGIIRLAGSKKQGTDNPLSFAQSLIQMQQKQNEDYLKRMEAASKPQAQQNPLELLKGVMDLQERVNGKSEVATQAAQHEASSGMSAAFQAMAASGDKTMQMMMAMMQAQQQQQAQQTQLLIAAMQPKEDPLTKVLMMKMMEDGGLGGSAAPPPPPPPPPSGPNIIDMITAITGLMGAMQPGDGGNDEFKSFMQAMLMKKEEEGLSTKDVIQILMREKEKPGTDDFRSAVDNMAAIMNIAQNINRQNEGGPAAGFFDVLAALFSNRDFAGSIAHTIRTRLPGGGQQQPQMTPQQQLAIQQRYLAQQAAANGGRIPPQAQPQVQQPTPQGQPRQPQVAQPSQPPQSSLGIPQLPSETADHLNGITEAVDRDDLLIERLVNMLIYFAEFEEWRGFTEKVLSVTRDGDKGLTLQYLRFFFEGLAKIHLIDIKIVKKVLKAVDTHFDAIQENLQDLFLKRDETVTGDALLSPVGDNGLPEEEPEENEEEDEEDPEDNE